MPDLISQGQPQDTPSLPPLEDVPVESSAPSLDTAPVVVEQTPTVPSTQDADVFAQFESGFQSRYGITVEEFVKSTRYVQDNFQPIHHDYTSRYEAESSNKLKAAWTDVEDFDSEYTKVNDAFLKMSPELQQQWLAHGETVTPGYAGAGAAIAIRQALVERERLAQTSVPTLDRSTGASTGGKTVFKRSQLRDKRWLQANGVTSADIELAWQEGRVENDIL